MLKKEDLESLKTHWALADIEQSSIARAEKDIDRILARKTLGAILPVCAATIDYANIEKLGNIYETIAISYMHDFISNNDEGRRLFIASAWKTYEFYAACELKEDIFGNIFDILHISSLAYCGERWNDIRGFYEDNKVIKIDINKNDSWDKVVLFSLYNCWITLFNKKNWSDLDEIIENIAELRKLQNEKEKELFSNDHSSKLNAIKLVALYHLAKSTELLATYATQGTPVNIKIQLDKHFEATINAAQISEDIELELIARWLYCAASQMVDAANYCMFEFMYPQKDGAYFKATESKDSAGVEEQVLMEY